MIFPEKKTSRRDFLLIIIGFMFFANPMVALADILPDFLGCALIMFALHRLSPVATDFEGAFNYFKYMIIASLARLFVFTVSGQFDGVTYLTVSLVLAISECIIAYLALTSLCDGISTLKHKFGTDEKDPTELRNIGLTFFVARGLCSILPYITSVLDREDDLLLPGHVEDTGDYTAVLTLVNIVICVIFAVFFAMTVIKHLSAYVKNKELCYDIRAAIEEKKIKVPEFFIRKNLVFCLVLLAYSTLFLIDFLAGLPVGGRNFIPDFVFGIIAVWVVIMLKKQLNGFLAPLISGAIYTAVSFANFFIYNDFLSKHFYTDFDALITLSLDEYLFAVAFSSVETVALIVFAILLARYLMPIATHFSHPDYTPEFVRLGGQIEKSRRTYRRLLIGFCVFLCLIALSGAALTAVFQIFDVGYDDVDFPYLLVHIIFHIIFFMYSSSLFLRLKAGVLKRYEAIPGGK